MLLLFALEIEVNFLDVGLILCFIKTHQLIFLIFYKCKKTGRGGDQIKKISILAQCLGSVSNLSDFDSKLRMTKYVQSAIFQKI